MPRRSRTRAVAGRSATIRPTDVAVDHAVAGDGASGAGAGAGAWAVGDGAATAGGGTATATGRTYAGCGARDRAQAGNPRRKDAAVAARRRRGIALIGDSPKGGKAGRTDRTGAARDRRGRPRAA